MHSTGHCALSFHYSKLSGPFNPDVYCQDIGPQNVPGEAMRRSALSFVTSTSHVNVSYVKVSYEDNRSLRERLSRDAQHVIGTCLSV